MKLKSSICNKKKAYIFCVGINDTFKTTQKHWEYKVSDKYFDKIIHFVLFFIQTLLILITLLLYGSNLNSKFILTITLFISLFALSTEIYQSILPLRKFDFFDFLSDFFGIVIALFYIKYFYK